MGGKSTLLRQTCLIAIMAQVRKAIRSFDISTLGLVGI